MTAVNHKERAHARLSASGAYRWMACTMSPTVEDQFGDSSTAHSKAGTWMHEWTETQLRQWLGQIDRQAYLAKLRDLEAQADELAPGMGQTPYEFLQAQKAAGRAYVEYVMGVIQDARKEHGEANVEVLVEQRMDFSRFVPSGFGTGDLVVITPKKIMVIDLKGGQGVRVFGENNPQLRLYGVGAVEMYGWQYAFEEVETVIVQPKLDHVSSEVIKTSDLMQWAEEVVKPVALIAHSGDGATFNPGEHCGFCKARATCRARAEQALADVDADYTPPNLLSEDELAKVYLSLDSIVAWAKDVKAAVEGKVLAGGHVPGIKVVRGRSNRQITDPQKAMQILKDAGFEEWQITVQPTLERPLLGLGELEKVVGKKALPEVLGELLVKAPGKLTVVSEADEREAVDVVGSTAEEDYT